MTDASLRDLHDRRYREARARGWPGWGGPERVASGEDFVDRVLLGGPAPPTGAALELGCGAGHVGRRLATFGYRVAGVDFSPRAIDWARDEARAAGASIRYEVADLGTSLDSLGFAAGHDLVVDANCLHCVVDDGARARLLANVGRVLRPDGTFLVSSRCARGGEAVRRIDGVPARRFPSPDRLVRELEAAGFRTLASERRERGDLLHVDLWTKRANDVDRPLHDATGYVRFSRASAVFRLAETRFDLVRRILERRVPGAEILHVGSTAVPGTLTKGDLDVAVRVDAHRFAAAAETLSRVAPPNPGSTSDDTFRAFACDAAEPPTGIQLVVRGTRLDRFHRWRDRLRSDGALRERYDALKRAHDGGPTAAYRRAKAAFIDGA